MKLIINLNRRMYNKQVIITIVLSIISFILLEEIVLVEAQEQNGWSAPHRLSSEEGQASEGFMASDQYGFLHVFWAENNLPDNRSIIQYARFDGNDWSTPLDIYTTQPGVAPGAGEVAFMSPVVDQQGLLHLVWTEGNTGPVYYSNTPAYDALSAHRWSSPRRIDIPAYQVKLQIDTKDVFHLVYSNFYGEEPGVYYLRSQDQGATWSSPHWLDPDIPYGQLPEQLDFALDDADGLHVALNYVNPFNTTGQAVVYFNSLDEGDNWSPPFAIDEPDEGDDELRMSQPGLAAHGKTVYVTWNGDTNLQREFRFSTDAGQTWSVPIQFFSRFQGAALGPGLTVDGIGRIHYIAFGRYPAALWHTYWDQRQWSFPSMIYLQALTHDEEATGRIGAHRIRLATRAGNQLVTTFTTAPSNPEQVLYAMHRTLDDVPPLATLSIPTPKPIVAPSPSPTSTPTSVTISPTSARSDIAGAVPPLVEPSAPSSPLWLGLVSAIFLVGIIVAFQLLRKR